MLTILEDPKVKTAEYIRDEKFVVKITRRFKSYKYPKTTDRHEDMVITSGRPGYLTRAFIKKQKKLGIRVIGVFRTKGWPVKKAKK